MNIDWSDATINPKLQYLREAIVSRDGLAEGGHIKIKAIQIGATSLKGTPFRPVTVNLRDNLR